MATLKEQYLEHYSYLEEVNMQAKSVIPSHMEEELCVAYIIDRQLFEETKTSMQQILVALATSFGVFCFPLSVITIFIFAGGFKVLCKLGKKVDKNNLNREKIKGLYPAYASLLNCSRKTIRKRIKQLNSDIEPCKETLEERGNIIRKNCFMIQKANETSIQEVENVKQIIMKHNRLLEAEDSILHVKDNRVTIEELKKCRDLLKLLDKQHPIWDTQFYNNYEQLEKGWLKKK